MILRVPIIMDIFTLMKYSVEEMLLPGKDAVTEIQEEKNMAETVRVVVDAMTGGFPDAGYLKATAAAQTIGTGISRKPAFIAGCTEVFRLFFCKNAINTIF